jgi:hypothetical protein
MITLKLKAFFTLITIIISLSSTVKAQEISNGCSSKLIDRLKKLRPECSTYYYLSILCTLNEKLQNVLADNYEANKSQEYCFSLVSLEEFEASIKTEIASVSLSNEKWYLMQLKMFGACAQAEQFFKSSNTIETANLSSVGINFGLKSGILISSLAQIQVDMAKYKFKRMFKNLFLAPPKDNESSLTKEEAVELMDLLEKFAKLLDKFFSIISEGKNACYLKLSELKKCNSDESNTLSVQSNANLTAELEINNNNNNNRLLQQFKDSLQPLDKFPSITDYKGIPSKDTLPPIKDLPKVDAFLPPIRDDAIDSKLPPKDTFTLPSKTELLEKYEDTTVRDVPSITDKLPPKDTFSLPSKTDLPQSFPSIDKLPPTKTDISVNQDFNLNLNTPLKDQQQLQTLKPTPELSSTFTKLPVNNLPKVDITKSIDLDIDISVSPKEVQEYLEKMKDYNKQLQNVDIKDKIVFDLPKKPELPQNASKEDLQKIVEMGKNAGLENLSTKEKEKIIEKLKDLDVKAQEIMKNDVNTVVDDLRDIILASMSSSTKYSDMVKLGFVEESKVPYCLNVNKVVEDPQLMKKMAQQSKLNRYTNNYNNNNRLLETEVNAEANADADLNYLLMNHSIEEPVTLNEDFDIHICGSSNITIDSTTKTIPKGATMSSEEFRKLVAAKIECVCGISVNLPPPPKILKNCSFASAGMTNSKENKASQGSEASVNFDIRECFTNNIDGSIAIGTNPMIDSMKDEAMSTLKKLSKDISVEYDGILDKNVSNTVNVELYLEDDVSKLLSNTKKTCSKGNFVWNCVAKNESGFKCSCDKEKSNSDLPIGDITPPEKKGLFAGIEELTFTLVCNNGLSVVFSKEKKFGEEPSINLNKTGSNGENLNLEKIKNKMISSVQNNKDLFKEVIKSECKEKMDKLLETSNSSNHSNYSDYLIQMFDSNSDNNILLGGELALGLLVDIPSIPELAVKLDAQLKRRRLLSRTLGEASTKTEFRSTSGENNAQKSFESYTVNVDNESKIAGATPNKVPSKDELLRLYDQEEAKAKVEVNFSVYKSVSFVVLTVIAVILS